MYEPYKHDEASDADRAAWILCQIMDDDAPLRWTRWRAPAEWMANNKELMAALRALGESDELPPDVQAHQAARKTSDDR